MSKKQNPDLLAFALTVGGFAAGIVKGILEKKDADKVLESGFIGAATGFTAGMVKEVILDAGTKAENSKTPKMS